MLTASQKRLLAVIAIILNSTSQGFAAKLLLVVVEGLSGAFYYEYASLDGFKHFENSGVWSDFVYGVFPTQKYPSHMSLLTGLTPRSHGLVSDHFYSITRDQYFMGGQQPSDSDPYWWGSDPQTRTASTARRKLVEPLWSSAAQAGASVAVFGWKQLCHIRFANRFTFCDDSPSSAISNDSKFYAILNVTQKHDLTIVYYDYIMQEASKIGLQQLRQRSNNSITILADFLHRLQKETVYRKDLNTVMVSIHGAIDLKKSDFDGEKIVGGRRLEDYMDMRLVNHTVGFGALAHLHAVPGKIDALFDQLRWKKPLPQVKAYRTSLPMTDLPVWYNYTKNERIAEILLVAQPGYFIYSDTPHKQVPAMWSTSRRLPSATMGYNPRYPDMLGVFLAAGPHFRGGRRLPSVHLLDIHSLLCHLLDVRCPEDQGSTASRLAPYALTYKEQDRFKKWVNGGVNWGFHSPLQCSGYKTEPTQLEIREVFWEKIQKSF